MSEYPNVSYIVEITTIDRQCEYYHYNVREYAKQHYDLIDEYDADIYFAVRLYAYNWVTKEDTLIEQKELAYTP